MSEQEFYKTCVDCGEMFVADAYWKTLCYGCFLKSVNPEFYKTKFEYDEITCERCGQDFVDEPWKDLCFRCWLATKQEDELDDLEEREQWK